MSGKSKKIILYGILDACPFVVEQDCPLAQARKMDYGQKLAWASCLSDQEIDLIVDQHQRCYERRLQDID
ncbi:MAG: hypothetical protein V1747_03895 [Candidatus Omnitrophota bacterium]